MLHIYFAYVCRSSLLQNMRLPCFASPEVISDLEQQQVTFVVWPQECVQITSFFRKEFVGFDVNWGGFPLSSSLKLKIPVLDHCCKLVLILSHLDTDCNVSHQSLCEDQSAPTWATISFGDVLQKAAQIGQNFLGHRTCGRCFCSLVWHFN